LADLPGPTNVPAGLTWNSQNERTFPWCALNEPPYRSRHDFLRTEIPTKPPCAVSCALDAIQAPRRPSCLGAKTLNLSHVPTALSHSVGESISMTNLSLPKWAAPFLALLKDPWKTERRSNTRCGDSEGSEETSIRYRTERPHSEFSTTFRAYPFNLSLSNLTRSHGAPRKTTQTLGLGHGVT